MFDIVQPTHLLFLLAVGLLVLGPKRLPEVGRSVGRGLRGFKAAINGDGPDPEHEIVAQISAESVKPANEPAAHTD